MEPTRIIGDCQLYCGDCLEVMPTLPACCVDMVLADLPYGTTRNKWDSVIPLDRLWAEWRRAVKSDAAIVLTAQTPFDKVLGCSNLGMLKYEWVWRKSRKTGHLNAKKAPLKGHENVLVFCSEPPTYIPQGLIRREVPTIRKGGDNGTNYGLSDKDAVQWFENYPVSVLDIPSEGKTVHPTQKPVPLMEYLIRTYTHEGQAVLDNTMGGGTTGVACIRTGRKFIGIEMDEKYFAVACRRIEDEYAKLAVAKAASPTLF